MSVKIRLQRKGRKQRPFYHIVIADARSPRDGRFIERIGSYNPLTKPATIEVDRDKAFEWLMKGAQPTDTVRAILRFKGVYYRKHLMRGVKKGALTIEEAETKYNEWVESKETKIAERFAQTAKEAADLNAKIAGTHIKVKKVEDQPVGLDIVEEQEPVEVAAEPEVITTDEVSIEDTTAEAVISEETSETGSEMLERTPDQVEDVAEQAIEEKNEG